MSIAVERLIDLDVAIVARRGIVSQIEGATEARASLSAFIRQAWPVIEPATEYLHNWHIDAISEHLESVTSGEIKRLLINMPPRYMKSISVTVMFPVWEWITKPHLRYLCSSYAATLSTKHSVDRRTVIQSQWYQERFGSAFQLTTDQNVKTEFKNNHQGVMIATSTGGSATGKGANRIIVDDPHNPQGAMSDTRRESDVQFFDRTLSTRLNDKKNDVIIVVMQRLHEEDVSARCLELGYTHLTLPATAEGRTVISLPSGKEFIREDASLLWEAREGRKELNDAARALGSYAYAGQYQQRPSPAEGGLLKREWFKFYEALPAQFDEIIQSWDMAFKDLDSSDYVVGQVWGRVGANRYLLDQVRGKLSFTATLSAVRTLSAKYPLAKAKLVEDKANGTAIIDTLSKEITGMIPVQPEGGKVARVTAVAPEIEAGNVYLPHPQLAAWVHDFIEESAAFPNGAHDDQVDGMSQALLRFALAVPKRRLMVLD